MFCWLFVLILLVCWIIVFCLWRWIWLLLVVVYWWVCCWWMVYGLFGSCWLVSGFNCCVCWWRCCCDSVWVICCWCRRIGLVWLCGNLVCSWGWWFLLLGWDVVVLFVNLGVGWSSCRVSCRSCFFVLRLGNLGLGCCWFCCVCWWWFIVCWRLVFIVGWLGCVGWRCRCGCCGWWCLFWELLYDGIWLLCCFWWCCCLNWCLCRVCVCWDWWVVFWFSGGWWCLVGWWILFLGWWFGFYLVCSGSVWCFWYWWYIGNFLFVVCWMVSLVFLGICIFVIGFWCWFGVVGWCGCCFCWFCWIFFWLFLWWVVLVWLLVWCWVSWFLLLVYCCWVRLVIGEGVVGYWWFFWFLGFGLLLVWFFLISLCFLVFLLVVEGSVLVLEVLDWCWFVVVDCFVIFGCSWLGLGWG